MLLPLLAVLMCLSLKASDTVKIASDLTSISVLIRTTNVAGSGTIFVRKDSTGTNDITFVWTAAHVILEDTTKFLMELGPFHLWFDPDCDTNKVVKQSIAALQFVVKDGRMTTTNRATAKVIAYNDDEDLALLRVEGNPYSNSVSFYLGKEIPPVGTELFSVSSPFAFTGASSFSVGMISFVGRIHDNNVFDQTTLVVYPGSSGGGVHRADEKYIGMCVISIASQMNFIIPVRRMLDWVKKEHIEWAMNPDVEIPNETILQSLVKH
jgi:hypothetical protein